MCVVCDGFTTRNLWLAESIKWHSKFTFFVSHFSCLSLPFLHSIFLLFLFVLLQLIIAVNYLNVSWSIGNRCSETPRANTGNRGETNIANVFWCIESSIDFVIVRCNQHFVLFFSVANSVLATHIFLCPARPIRIYFGFRSVSLWTEFVKRTTKWFDKTCHRIRNAFARYVFSFVDFFRCRTSSSNYANELTTFLSFACSSFSGNRCFVAYRSTAVWRIFFSLFAGVACRYGNVKRRCA